MEVKINKEISDYTEAIFFGLSLRQFIFSVLACGIAIGLYFLLHPYMSMETVSWICVLGAAPANMVRNKQDVRFTLISKLADPDAYGAERVSITGVQMDDLTLFDWEAPVVPYFLAILLRVSPLTTV